MQGTWVQSLVWEDSTCSGTTKPMCHQYWARTLQPTSHNYWGPSTQSLSSSTGEATTMRSLCTAMKRSSRSFQAEKHPATKIQQQPKKKAESHNQQKASTDCNITGGKAPSQLIQIYLIYRFLSWLIQWATNPSNSHFIYSIFFTRTAFC